jgi:hypothetical protein
VQPPTYPNLPGAPQIVGNYVYLDRWAKNPTDLTTLINITTLPKFISPYLFRSASADGGAVLYNVATIPQAFLAPDPNLQPGEIGNGAEFPIVNVDDLPEQVGLVNHYGGQFPVTYTQARRANRDVVSRGLRKLSNTLIKLSDGRAIAAFRTNASVPRVPAAALWTSAGQKAIQDILTGITYIEAQDMGYVADTLLGHPITLGILLGLDTISARLPREAVATNPIFLQQMPSVMGLNVVPTTQMLQTEVTIASSQVVGAVAQEIPQYSRVVDDAKVETYWVQAARFDIPVITDPLSSYTITGVV